MYAPHYFCSKTKIRDLIMYRISYRSLKTLQKGIFSGKTSRHIAIMTQKTLKYETFFFYLWVSKGRIFPVYVAKKSQLSLKEAEEEEGVDNNHCSAVSLSDRPNSCLLVRVDQGRRKWSMVGKKRKPQVFKC